MSKSAIIVIAYNRINSLKRIMKRLIEAEYNEEVDLIVSIDKSDVQPELIEVGNRIKWEHGSLKIIAQKNRLGLRKHILSCGDIVHDYESIIMFEDDIIPSKYFHNFVSEAVEFYKNDPNIGGISLYSPQINEMVEKPFVPIHSEYSSFFLKSASSWGQCWTKKMWLDFRSWYKENDDTLINIGDMPEKIYSWPETSWKKYYMKYLVVTNKYFVYPYISLSTNLSDLGQHVKKENSMYQVPLLMNKLEYKLPEFKEGIKYDAFFENESLKKISLDIDIDIDTDIEETCIDIYGSKKKFSNYRYLLSSNIHNYKIISTYGLSYKPQELNFIYKHPGKVLYLYDLNEEKRNKIQRKKNQILSYYSSINWKDALSFGVDGGKDVIKKRVKIIK